MQRLRRNRESELWGKVVEQVGSAPEGSKWTHIFDRGGDNFEAMCRVRSTGCDWLIRAAKMHRKVINEHGETVKLKDAIKNGRKLGSYELHLRKRQEVQARIAKIEVSAVTLTFPRPLQSSKWVKNCGIKQLTMNVVIVQEVNLPPGVTPIKWVLFTSLPIDTFEQAWQIIEDYENRWIIEEYHKVMKTGCSLEAHALRTADRLEPLIGLITVIGTRLLQLKFTGRSQPEAKAATHVPASWLKCLHLACPKLKMTGMTVYTFFREIAKLGGFLARKCDGEPGWQSIWHGYKKLQSLLDGMRMVGAI